MASSSVNDSQDLESIKTEIRSILISSAKPLTEHQLENDYRKMADRKGIPYRNFGYPTLYHFLKSMPDVVRLNMNATPYLIHGVATADTQHIHDLVKRQISRGRPSSRSVARRGYWAHSMSSHSPAPSYPTGGIRPFFPAQERLPDITTRAFTSKTEGSTPISGRMPITIAAFNPPQSPDDYPAINVLHPASPRDLTKMDEEVSARFGPDVVQLRKNIRKILLDFSSTGIWMGNLNTQYKKLVGEDIHPQKFRLKSPDQILETIQNMVDCSAPSKVGEKEDFIISLKKNLIDAAQYENSSGYAYADVHYKHGESEEIVPQIITNELDQHIPVKSKVPQIENFQRTSDFVEESFRYERSNCIVNEEFKGFVINVDNFPEILIVKSDFVIKQENFAKELDEHYRKHESDEAYTLPYEQVKENAACVTLIEGNYRRVYIVQINRFSTRMSACKILVHCVDSGFSRNVEYHQGSKILKCLEKKFSKLPIEIYESHLANILMIEDAAKLKKAADLVRNFCTNEELIIKIMDIRTEAVEVVVASEKFLGITLNEILVKNNLAKWRNFNTDLESVEPNETERNFVPIQNEDNHVKIISVSNDLSVYLVKDPFTGRACLPCFELSRILGVDEKELSTFTRTAGRSIEKGQNFLFDEILEIPLSTNCSHRVESKNFFLYDLQNVQEFLTRNSFEDGDLLDALKFAFDRSENENFWHEKCENFSNESWPYFQREKYAILFSRRRTLEDLVHLERDPLIEEEIREINEKLRDLPEDFREYSTNIETKPSSKSARAKMRETRFRIARPFEKEFGLTTCFEHQLIDQSRINEIEDIEERFNDLGRIISNIIKHSGSELPLESEEDEELIEEAKILLPRLKENESLEESAEIYNHFLSIAQWLQPKIKQYFEENLNSEFL